MKYYTYIHFRKDTDKVFYVGKGTGNRHKSKSHRNRHWKFVVEKVGFESEVCGLWNTEEEAYEHEIFLIECFKKMGCELVNSTPGGKCGNGGYWKGKKRPDHAAKMSGEKHHNHGRKGINHPLFGRIPWNKGLKFKDK